MNIDVLADDVNASLFGGLGDRDRAIDLFGDDIDAGVGEDALARFWSPFAAPHHPAPFQTTVVVTFGLYGLRAEGKGIDRSHQLRDLKATLEAKFAALADMGCRNTREIHAGVTVRPIGSDIL